MLVRARRWLLAPEQRMPVLVYLWAQLILLLWWAGQFPGMISYDSTVYVTHVTTGPWDAAHSVLYDFLVKISLGINRSFWVLTLVQTAAWALALSYTATSVRMWGVRDRWAALPAVLLPLVPSFGILTSFVWKDEGFALCEVLLNASLLRLLRIWSRTAPGRSAFGRRRVEGDEKPPVPWRLLVAIALEFLGLVLFRGDGFLMVGVITVIFFFVLRGLRVHVLALGAIAAVGMVAATSVVYPAFDIKPAPSSLAYGTFYADVALVYSEDPGVFTAADKALMTHVAPLRVWKAGDDCLNSDKFFRAGVNRKAANIYRHQLAKLWFRILGRAPVELVTGRLCRAAIAWNPFVIPSDRGQTILPAAVVPKGLFGRAKKIPADIAANIRPDPLIGPLGDLTTRARSDLRNDFWQTVMWRGATWCYLAYLVLFLAVRRLRNWRVLAAGSVCLANQLMVMAANPAQLFRYMAGPIAIGILLLGLLAVPRAEPDAPAPADEVHDEPETVPAG